MILEERLMKAIEKEIKQIILEETELAISGVRRRIAEEADKIALHILKSYSIKDMGDRIIIEVRKRENER